MVLLPLRENRIHRRHASTIRFDVVAQAFEQSSSVSGTDVVPIDTPLEQKHKSIQFGLHTGCRLNVKQSE
jgi:hypothetical protein